MVISKGKGVSMDIMQIAGHVSISEVHDDILGVTGPFYGNSRDRNFSQSAVIYLRNGYAIRLAKGDNALMRAHDPMDSDTAEMMVMREDNESDETVYWQCRDNPVTADVVYSATVADIIEAVKKLRDLPRA